MLSEISKSFGKFEKPAIPHMTIGRVKFLKNRESLMNKINKMEKIDIGPMKIERIVLYQSILQKKGPDYKELKVVTLHDR